ncbi:SpoIIE family protein phosphatase, partial [Streptomyces sp. T-3]|nr:SpoIIE family protein phosphatase [Streptomyces sp. T-3]
DRLTAGCNQLALRLERAAGEGRPVLPEIDLASPPLVTGVSAAAEAVRMVARLPYGMCALDVDARVTYASPAAVDLLGTTADRLLGTPLWNALPWLNDPAYEDRYRAALISQQNTSFMALRPPGDWLSFHLYPSHTGLTVRITRARAGTGRGSGEDASRDGRSRLVTISQVLSLAGALTEAASVRDVIDLAADEIMPAVGSQAMVVLGSGRGRLHVLGHRGYPEPAVVERFDGMPLSAQTPGAHVLSTGVPAFFESRWALEHLYPSRYPTPDGMAAWAYLPLIASGRPVGTCVLGFAEPHRFSADDRAVLTSLGGLIAQALERARLYDAKHRLAHGLQAALLPHSLPRLPGLEVAARYLPATQGMEIGGDFYDLMRTGGAPAAVIGDVQGHNVTAAGLMGQLRSAVRAYTSAGQDPGTTMSSTNRLLIDLDADLLASCLHVQLDLDRGEALLARAGHPHPLLYEPGQGVRTVEVPCGPLLGVDPAAVYPTTAVPLRPGSVLVLYTDGLVETPGGDLDAAVADLAAHLGQAADRPLEQLADSLIEHTGQVRERRDDIALMLLRATGTQA